MALVVFLYGGKFLEKGFVFCAALAILLHRVLSIVCHFFGNVGVNRLCVICLKTNRIFVGLRGNAGTLVYS